MDQRPCPVCHSSDIRRSRRRDLFEQVVLRLILVRPYRCTNCDHRFYGWRRHGPAAHAPVSPERATQISTLLLALFLFVPLAWGLKLKPEAAPYAASAQRAPLGALQATGGVLVNNAPFEGESTVFIGDTLETGANGAASITIAGRGRLILAARTQVILTGAPRYLVSLEVGTLGLNAQADAQSFQVRVGKFLVVPSPGVAATAEIERAADGSARISCMGGSVGVIEMEGADVVFLRAGQSARISADGVFSVSTPSTPAPAAEKPPPTIQKGGRRTGLIVLLVAGGGAAGAAAALAGKKDKSPLSPSVP
jgi:ferric-dicitrate binding protein FerR (iron transport regulator)